MQDDDITSPEVSLWFDIGGIFFISSIIPVLMYFGLSV